ncbi:uncharacterized protein LOC143560943 [Bidens hawaiensis]|uniref:uncharacterized protein LOC143560943 n=1 Tax=Bidens hawaiensis TaxID=980011 RepID=UPI00404B0E71
MVLADKQKGGIDIGSLKGINLALLQKWKWRFVSRPNDLWVKVIKVFHGNMGGVIGGNEIGSGNGVWHQIVKSSRILHEKDIIIWNTLKKKVGNREDCIAKKRIKDVPLPLNVEWSGGVGHRRDQSGEIEFFNHPDSWFWDFDVDNKFSVQTIRKHIDAMTLPDWGYVTQWNRLAPKIVNILGWRIYHNRKPLRTNLVNKGIDVPSVLYPFCLNSEESSDHVFGACGVATRVWNNICKWLDLPLILDFSVLGILIWLDTLSVNSKKQKLIHGIILSAW